MELGEGHADTPRGRVTSRSKRPSPRSRTWLRVKSSSMALDHSVASWPSVTTWSTPLDRSQPVPGVTPVETATGTPQRRRVAESAGRPLREPSALRTYWPALS